MCHIILLCQGPLTVPGTFEWLLVAHRGSVGGYSHQASKPKQTWNAYSLTFHSSYETLFLKVLKIVSATEQLTTFLLPIAPDPAWESILYYHHMSIRNTLPSCSLWLSSHNRRYRTGWVTSYFFPCRIPKRKEWPHHLVYTTNTISIHTSQSWQALYNACRTKEGIEGALCSKMVHTHTHTQTCTCTYTHVHTNRPNTPHRHTQ